MDHFPSPSFAKETSRRAAGAATASVEISFAGNETPTLLQADAVGFVRTLAVALIVD